MAAPQVRLAAAAAPPRASAEGVWSEFAPVTQPTVLSLPLGADELLHAVLSVGAERSVGGALCRELAVRPALRVSSDASVPLRLCACGQPYFRSLPARSPDRYVELEVRPAALQPCCPAALLP